LPFDRQDNRVHPRRSRSRHVKIERGDLSTDRFTVAALTLKGKELAIDQSRSSAYVPLQRAAIVR
jgi:hypothetical protein